ncbi:hypothetical protein BGW36DRAFT_423036 [Talaromyces proteolyticus]|uniref:Rhodopsin domain-containing protein n=1 Tax=Talaromyces proteolyticus TaxID=1131652 RepID=A0AAD4Q4U1_9EURO|nr:uncharacterized protein BGW36DRAFT_423036 [Talaromyces proteolyticus]KAH8703474.1 hypothetical protein BGW36DRAFT_423036 [Talaromyces proteolyticus]
MQTSRQESLVVVSIIMIVIPCLAVALRIWSIIIDKKYRMGLDDICIIVALPFVCGTVATTIALVYDGGLGMHKADVEPTKLLANQKIFLAASILDDISLTLPKLSAVFFYNRIFQRTHTAFYYSFWILGSIIVSWLVATLVVNLTVCTPPSKAWDPTVDGHCRDWFPSSLGPAIMSAVIDLAILLWPMPFLFQLRLSKKKRLLLVGVFAIGYCVLIVSLGRVIALAKIGPDAFAGDATWDIVSYVQWGQAEAPVSVLSVSLPRIAYVITHYLRKTSIGRWMLRPSDDDHKSSKASFPTKNSYNGHSGLRSIEGEEYVRLNDVNYLQERPPYNAQVNASGILSAPTTHSTWYEDPTGARRNIPEIHVKRDIQVSREDRV